jgi:hypothetical protein
LGQIRNLAGQFCKEVVPQVASLLVLWHTEDVKNKDNLTGGPNLLPFPCKWTICYWQYDLTLIHSFLKYAVIPTKPP